MSRSEDSLAVSPGPASSPGPFVYSSRRSVPRSSTAEKGEALSDTAVRASSSRSSVPQVPSLHDRGIESPTSLSTVPPAGHAENSAAAQSNTPSPDHDTSPSNFSDTRDSHRSGYAAGPDRNAPDSRSHTSFGDHGTEVSSLVPPPDMGGSVSEMNRPCSYIRPSFSSSSLNSSRVVVGAEELVSNFKNSLVAQRRRHLERHGETLSVMCIGESGAGKTTALSSLFVQPVPRRSVSTPSTKRIEESAIDLLVGQDDAAVNIHVRTIDSPGYGDEIDVYSSFKRITDYIESGFDKIIQLEAEDNRPDFHSLDRNIGVDAVLYFINPHRLKKFDVEFLRRVHKLASVIPIIAKADTLTSIELMEFRKDVKKHLEAENIDVFAGPYAIISCGVTSTAPEGNECEDTVYYSRGREYAWGTAFADNPDHSDLPILRQLLLTDGLLELHEARREKFEVYRREKALKERRRRRSVLGCMSRLQRWVLGIGVHTVIGLSALKLIQMRLQAMNDPLNSDMSLRINHGGWPFGKKSDKARIRSNNSSRSDQREGDKRKGGGLFGGR